MENRLHVSSHLRLIFRECFSCFLPRLTLFPHHKESNVGLQQLCRERMACADNFFFFWTVWLVRRKIASTCLATCDDSFSSVSSFFVSQKALSTSVGAKFEPSTTQLRMIGVWRWVFFERVVLSKIAFTCLATCDWFFASVSVAFCHE